MSYEEPNLTWLKVIGKWLRDPLDTLVLLTELTCFAVRSRPAGWWKTAPFLPIANKTYRKWRHETAYGKHTPTFKQLLFDMHDLGTWLKNYRSYT